MEKRQKIVTDEMAEAGAKVIAECTRTGIIEAPKLDWPCWMGTARAIIEAALARCLRTGNPVGTDTEMVGYSCQCQVCRLSRQLAEAQVGWDNARSDCERLIRERDAINNAAIKELAEARAELKEWKQGNKDYIIKEVAMSEWRQMGSAPTDGTEILIWYECGRGRIATSAHFYRLTDKRGIWKTSTVWVDNPGGWTFLPEPPKTLNASLQRNLDNAPVQTVQLPMTTDTQEDEAVGTMDCPLCTSIEQCLCVDRGRWGTETADRIATLTRQLAEVREEVERFRREFEASSEFDNFECEFGTTLGKCVESNHCVACSAKRLLDALFAKPTGTGE